MPCGGSLEGTTSVSATPDVSPRYVTGPFWHSRSRGAPWPLRRLRRYDRRATSFECRSGPHGQEHYKGRFGLSHTQIAARRTTSAAAPAIAKPLPAARTSRSTRRERRRPRSLTRPGPGLTPVAKKPVRQASPGFPDGYASMPAVRFGHVRGLTPSHRLVAFYGSFSPSSRHCHRLKSVGRAAGLCSAALAAGLGRVSTRSRRVDGAAVDGLRGA